MTRPRVASALGKLASGFLAGIALACLSETASAQEHGSWAGFYIGANAGYQWGAGDRTLSMLPDLAAWLAESPDYAQFQGGYGNSPDGFLGGAQLGFNWRIGTALVGVETDIQWLNAESTSERNVLVTDALGTFLVQARVRHELDWLGTLRGRVGIPFHHESVLLYLTGGLAYGRIITSHSLLDDLNDGFAGSSSGWEVGGTIGGGVEWALRDKVSLKAEYLYYDLGERTVRAERVNAPAPFNTELDYDTAGHIVRVGLNYRLGGP